MRTLNKIDAGGRRFRQDERGVVMIWYALMLTAIIALIGLAINAVAFMNLNSSQQEVADAAALAGANKLDGSSGARSRATTAATSSLGNSVSWSNDGASGASPIATVKFYDTLAALKAGTPESTSDQTAGFIKVTTENRSYIPDFLRVVTTRSGTSRASAAASSQYLTCAPLQSFMCNPYEPVTGSTGDASSFMASGKVKIGDQFVLTQGSGSDPGNWGLIQPPGTSGNAETTHSPYWSAQGTSSCVVSLPGQNLRTTAPGNTAKNAVAGMNVRFDRMTSVAGVDLTSSPIAISGFNVAAGTEAGTSCSRNVSATPTGFTQTNVCTDGKSKDKLDNCTGVIDQSANLANYKALCGASSPTGSCPFPRDNKFTKLGSSTGWGSILKGDGVDPDALAAYWTNQHGSTATPTPATRWAAYQAEVKGEAFRVSPLEAPTPQCKMGQSASATAERRLINVGIVDCRYWNLSGRSTLPTLTLSLKMFMTEPATTDGEIYAELVEVSEANQSGGPVKHIVKLVQ